MLQILVGMVLLTYNNSTGAITYTGPSATETRSHISVITGVSIADGEISIGQPVATSSNVTFNNVTISGNLTVSGIETIIETTHKTITDPLIELASGTSGTPSQDSGIVIMRAMNIIYLLGLMKQMIILLWEQMIT